MSNLNPNPNPNPNPSPDPTPNPKPNPNQELGACRARPAPSDEPAAWRELEHVGGEHALVAGHSLTVQPAHDSRVEPLAGDGGGRAVAARCRQASRRAQRRALAAAAAGTPNPNSNRNPNRNPNPNPNPNGDPNPNPNPNQGLGWHGWRDAYAEYVRNCQRGFRALGYSRRQRKEAAVRGTLSHPTPTRTRTLTPTLPLALTRTLTPAPTLHAKR